MFQVICSNCMIEGNNVEYESDRETNLCIDVLHILHFEFSVRVLLLIFKYTANVADQSTVGSCAAKCRQIDIPIGQISLQRNRSERKNLKNLYSERFCKLVISATF